MSDPMTQLFTAALGLSEPWRVKAARFEQAKHEIHFDVVCDATRLLHIANQLPTVFSRADQRLYPN